MRISHVDTNPGEFLGIVARTDERSSEAHDLRLAHIHPNDRVPAAELINRNSAQPCSSAHPQGSVDDTVRAVNRGNIVCKDADTIPAHLSNRTVTIAVVHKPIVGLNPLRQCRQNTGIDEFPRTGNPQDAVSAKTTLSIAHCCDQ